MRINSEITMNLKLCNDSFERAKKELNWIAGNYPRVGVEVLDNISKYLKLNPMEIGDFEVLFVTSIDDDLYRLIELVYDIKLVNVTTEDSKHREFMEVAND